MAIDFSKLRESKLWNLKMDRAVRVQDIDKSGDISRADFELMIERYSKQCTSTPEKREAYAKEWSKICDRMGLTDESVRLSYDEFKEKFVEDFTNSGTWQPMFEAAFSYMDLNDDGVMSFEEWKAHYSCVGIDLAHARPSFDAMDQNHDGVVSKEEFLNFVFEYYCTGENKLGSANLYGPLD